MYNSEFKLRGKIKMILLTHCVSVSVWILVMSLVFQFPFVKYLYTHTVSC